MRKPTKRALEGEMIKRLQRQLKEKLINENIKLREIARITDISPATLSRIARGKGLTLETYQVLNNYLNPVQDQPNIGWKYFVSYIVNGLHGNTEFELDKPLDSLEQIRLWEKDLEKDEAEVPSLAIILNWEILRAPTGQETKT